MQLYGPNPVSSVKISRHQQPQANLPKPQKPKGKATELKLEDLVSQEDKFTFDYDLEMVCYGDPVEQILIQHFSEIENPPPENLHLTT